MITFTTEAETIDELRQKLLDAAGFGETVGRYTHADETAPQAGESAKRTRRTKEQISADDEIRRVGADLTSEVNHLTKNVSAGSDTSPSGNQGEQTDGGAASGQTAPSDASRSDGAYDYQTDIKPQVLKVSQKHGRPGVEKLLAPYAVTNAQQIPAEKYAKLLVEIDAALADDGYVS